MPAPWGAFNTTQSTSAATRNPKSDAEQGTQVTTIPIRSSLLA